MTRFNGLGGGTLQIWARLPPEFNRDLYKTGQLDPDGRFRDGTDAGTRQCSVSGRGLSLVSDSLGGLERTIPVLTVQGPDWRMPIPPLGIQQFGAPRPAVWAVFVPRVVNVYTKTMPLEM